MRMVVVSSSDVDKQRVRDYCRGLRRGFHVLSVAPTSDIVNVPLQMYLHKSMIYESTKELRKEEAAV